VYSATKSPPKTPGVPQPEKSPTADAFRKQNAAAMMPGAAAALSDAGTGNVGTPGLAGTNTLLGR
jgi:hypothetical protein